MRTRRLAVVALLVGVVACGPAAGKTRPTANGIEAIHTATWPTAAVRLAKSIAAASFAHDYARVWGYLHPSYRKAVSQAVWARCQRSHPAAPRSVTVTGIAVAQASQVPVWLALLGRNDLQEIQLLVRFTTPAAAGPQAAILYTFWVRDGKAWHAVWLSDEYAAYRAGRCYATPQGPPLY